MKDTTTPPMDDLGHRLCDYSDTDYASFWADEERSYEDLVERIALRRLTDGIGGTCLEIGCGYGRLVNEYARACDRVMLTDYAENMLAQARERVRLLELDHVECRRMNLYHLGQVGEQFDNAICIRVLHHVESVPDFFWQVNLALCDGGTFYLEYANKRNLKEIFRWLFHRPNIRPFDRQPTKRMQNVYYNFHPAYIRHMLLKSGFQIEEELSVSLFRSAFLKRIIGAEMLAKIEKPLQRPLGPLHLSPSVFIKARKIRNVDHS